MVLVVGLVGAVSGCNSWTHLWGGPGHTAYNPDETALTPATAGQISELWASPLTVDTPLVTSGNRVVFLTGGGLLTALDTATGQVAWQSEETTEGWPAIQGDVVYTTAAGAQCASAMVAWDLSTGARRPADDIHGWQGTDCETPNGLQLMGDRYSLLSGFGVNPPSTWVSIRLHDRTTGTVTPLYVDNNVWQTMDEANERFFVTLTRHGAPASTQVVIAFGPDGGQLWRRDIFSSGDSYLPVATDGSKVYANNWEGISVLDAATGATDWVGLAPRPPEQNPETIRVGAVKDGVVYASGPSGMLVYTDCGTAECTPDWTADARPLAAAGDLVYGVDPETPGLLEVYDAGGCGHSHCAPLTTLTAGPSLSIARVIVAGGKIFVAADDGIHAFGIPASG